MPNQAATCPVGELSCPLVDEVVHLRQQVITDPLTGLFNVRYFREMLEQELERTQRTRMSTAVMMVDLDHFKCINDSYGHEDGNTVLRHTARLIAAMTRRLDVRCRYGGEEFVVILPSTELAVAKQVAERVRAALASTPVDISENSITVTASIGLAICRVDEYIGAAQLVQEADKWLYEAKRQGRNRVCFNIPIERDQGVSQDEKDALRGLFGGD
jgi:diguanylate cyclase (GGDEF)-like protein